MISTANEATPTANDARVSSGGAISFRKPLNPAKRKVTTSTALPIKALVSLRAGN
jgi:hypothetical protein